MSDRIPLPGGCYSLAHVFVCTRITRLLPNERSALWVSLLLQFWRIISVRSKSKFESINRAGFLGFTGTWTYRRGISSCVRKVHSVKTFKIRAMHSFMLYEGARSGAGEGSLDEATSILWGYLEFDLQKCSRLILLSFPSQNPLSNNTFRELNGFLWRM